MAQTHSHTEKTLRVVILGDAGAFGFKLAELLARDGHGLWLPGRSKRQLRRAAVILGAEIIVCDWTRSLDPLFLDAPDVVVDASGPFHRYGADPYA